MRGCECTQEGIVASSRWKGAQTVFRSLHVQCCYTLHEANTESSTGSRLRPNSLVSMLDRFPLWVFMIYERSSEFKWSSDWQETNFPFITVVHRESCISLKIIWKLFSLSSLSSFLHLILVYIFIILFEQLNNFVVIVSKLIFITGICQLSQWKYDWQKKNFFWTVVFRIFTYISFK